MMRGAIILLSFAISFFPWPASVSAHDHDHTAPMKASEPLSGTSIYNLTSSWTDQDGKRVTLESLRGQPVVVAMAYTSCKDICPMIVADMVAIEDRAKEASLKGIRFAFFSLDSAIDTPERLTAYAKDRGLDPAHWTLYQGEDKAVRELAAVLGVRYRRDASGGFDHSAIITILDADGRIVAQQPDAQANTEEMVKKITALVIPASH
jgi:protein SCO1/2